MTANPSALDHPDSTSSTVPGDGFLKIFGTGVAGWVLGMVALFATSWIVSKPETAPIAMLWMISHCWIAFLLGLLLMLLRGLASRSALAKPLIAYVLPVALLAGLAGICLAIYPDAGLRGDFLTYLPVVLVFYCFGCLWMALGGERAGGGAFLRAVIPSLAGGLIILGFVAVPAFASDSFRYRAAFQLNSKETRIESNTMIFEGTLEIMKPGNYAFSAPRYTWAENFDNGEETNLELGEIQWGKSGAPRDGALGVFPMRILWRKGVLPEALSQLPPYEDYIVLEVRRPDQDNKLVYTLSAKMNPEQ